MGLLAFALVLGTLLQASSSLHDGAIPLRTGPDGEFDPDVDPWMEQVGEHPLVYYFHNFLTPAERRHMISLAAPQMKRSTVVGQHGESVVDSIRTSYGMFIRRLQDPIIQRIENRISLWTQTPMSHQEDIQVLRYTEGQTYGAHYDSSGNSKDHGPTNRLFTFYMYLSDVEEGGETAFPLDSQWSDPSLPEKLGGPTGWSKCAQGHVAAKPKAGDAALFYSFYRNGTMDPASMHTGCPVLKGIKWGAPVWVHVDEFRPNELLGVDPRKGREQLPDPGACEDMHSECEMWAERGECTKNPSFMLGGDFALGACRKACKGCEMCAEGDGACINRNRKKFGYLELNRSEMQWLGVDLGH